MCLFIVPDGELAFRQQVAQANDLGTDLCAQEATIANMDVFVDVFSLLALGGLRQLSVGSFLKSLHVLAMSRCTLQVDNSYT